MKDTIGMGLTLDQFHFVAETAQKRVNDIANMWANGYGMERCKEEVTSLLKLKEEAELRIRDWDLIISSRKDKEAA